MDFTFKKDLSLNEDELIITHNSDETIISDLQQFLSDQRKQRAPLSLYSGETQYFIKMEDILFFETEANMVFAHTEDDAYESSYRLYELEKILDSNFLRISKSTIVNTQKIVSISRYLSASGVVNFQKTHKEVYVSRMYYQILKTHLEKRTRL